MLINNPEALKSWLVVVLEPLCDADSSALARYVLALVKKDKPEKDLKRMMIDQLDVFLGDATKNFVERLFNAINSEEYLNLPHNVLNTAQNIEAANSSVAIIDAAIDADEIVLDVATSAAFTVAPTMLTGTSVSLNEENVIKSDQHNSNNEANKITASQNSSASSSMLDALQTTPAHDHKTKETQFNTSTTTHDTYASERLHASLPVAGAVVSIPTTGENSSNSNHYTHQQQHHVRSASPPTRTNADKENQPRDNRRRRASLRSRSRSRSRSNERQLRRSRSRDRRINEREKNQRQFRNKSPPMASSEQRHHTSSGGGAGRRNFDRRRLGGIVGSGGGGGSINDERSSRFGGGNKSRLNRSNSPRSRSPTPERSQRGGNHARASPERHHTHHHHMSQQLIAHDVIGMNEPRQRCRDFDEKGYCVRGETCPWDHGVNPVVFEGINNSALISMSLREYNPDAPDLWSRSGPTTGVQPPPPAGSINPFTGNVRPNATMHAAAAPVGAPNVGSTAEYARGAGGPGMMPFPFNPTAVTTPLQRQLVPIPVVDANNGGAGGAAATAGGGIGGEMSKRRYELEDTVAIADGPPKRKVPINSRLGPRVDRANMQHNCSLELRKVPRGLNTIAHLNNHFAKFGKIVNIQVSYDGDPEAAIITFSAHAEANVAYRSTEAVLNNRFIKVFWHSQDLATGADALNTSGGGGIGSGGRKNASQYHLHNVPAIPTADSAKTTNNTSQQAAAAAATTAAGATTTTTTINNESNNTTTTTVAVTGQTLPTGETAATTASPASLRLKRGPAPANTAAIIRKKEEQAKAVVQLANGLRKRKQELLASYVKQMKSALELVERCEPQDPQRAKTLSTIKVLQDTIDKLQKEIAAEQAKITSQKQQQNQQLQPPPTKRTKEQQKKELLDIELELIAQQQEGNDTSAIQKRLEELQRNLGSGGGGGNAALAGVVGGAKYIAAIAANRASKPIRASYPEGSTRVDRRPKTIVVTGFAAEDADFVLGHFKHFGEITKHDVDREIPQLILSYATRVNAEQAVLRGKLFKDKRLQISWAPVVQTTQVQATSAADKMSQATTINDTDNIKLENPKQLAQSVSETESIMAGDTLPELRLEDEEEDDESEDRSWRR